VAAPAAAFAFTEVRLGIVPGVIAPLVVERVGAAAARAAFLTGDRLAADAALAMGLVDRLAAGDEDLDAAVGRVVDSLLAGGPAALGRVKALLDGVASLGYARSAEQAARMIAEARTGPEGQAALAAFTERRPVPWLGDEPWTAPAWPGADEEA
jgi:methylglutaconyl-CoA hydratase